MSKSAAAMFVLVFLMASCLIGVKPVSAASPNSWTSKAPMRQARGGLGVAVVNGKIYAIGGSTESGLNPRSIGIDYKAKGWVVDTNEEYDPATDKWAFKTPMPTPRYGFAIVAYQNKLYCIGGASNFQPPNGFYGAILTGVNEVYDPATNTWETKASMPTARIGLQANVVGDKIYLIGGDPNRTINEVYDPATDTWETKEPMPTVASSYASAVFDNEIYVIGGYGSGNLNQIYNPETDKWRLGAPAPLGVTDGAAGATTGMNAPTRIYVLGVLNFMYQDSPPNRIYDPKSDTWTLGADVPTNRLNFGVAIVNDTLYAIGGIIRNYPHELSNAIFTATPSAVNEQYTPIGYGTVPPVVQIVSPSSQTYNESSVSLVLTVNKPVNWMGYSLDGQDNVTINGNTTISGLTSGLHNVTVYARDELNNTGASETVSFTVEVHFPTALVATASGVSATIIGIGFIVYYKKRRH
ncbi:hypothetical protein JXA31_04380 [Candidatus Bathyarchaeota archaeon]|nr:hypothetical protein [Candidatus Bathyarchaeota archaeon]